MCYTDAFYGSFIEKYQNQIMAIGKLRWDTTGVDSMVHTMAKVKAAVYIFVFT